MRGLYLYTRISFQHLNGWNQNGLYKLCIFMWSFLIFVTFTNKSITCALSF